MPEPEPVKQPAPKKTAQVQARVNIPKSSNATPRMKPPEATPIELPPVEQPRTPPPARVQEQPKAPPPQRIQPRVQESQPPSVNPSDFLPVRILT